MHMHPLLLNKVKDEKGIRIIDILGELASQGTLDYDKIVELHKNKFVAALQNVVEKEVNHFSKLCLEFMLMV